MESGPAPGAAGQVTEQEQTREYRRGRAVSLMAQPFSHDTSQWVWWPVSYCGPQRIHFLDIRPPSQQEGPEDQILQKGRWLHFCFYRSFQNSRVAWVHWLSQAVEGDLRQQRPAQPLPSREPTIRPCCQHRFGWSSGLGFERSGGRGQWSGFGRKKVLLSYLSVTRVK